MALSYAPFLFKEVLAFAVAHEQTYRLILNVILLTKENHRVWKKSNANILLIVLERGMRKMGRKRMKRKKGRNT